VEKAALRAIHKNGNNLIDQQSGANQQPPPQRAQHTCPAVAAIKIGSLIIKNNQRK